MSWESWDFETDTQRLKPYTVFCKNLTEIVNQLDPTMSGKKYIVTLVSEEEYEEKKDSVE